MSPTVVFAVFFRLVVAHLDRFAAAFLLLAGLASATVAVAQDQAADALRFDILEYQIDGNSVLPVEAIERAVTPFLGPGKSMNEVEGARSALEQVYQQAGYLTVFVDVPEQAVEGGLVRLNVTEGRVDRLSVSGSRYYSQGYIRGKVQEFAESRVPNFNVAQQQLAIVNRTEDRRVQPVLKPGLQPGTVDIDLKVDDRLPLSGSVELNNDHAVDTTPWRVAASLRYDNLFQRDHGLALNAVFAPVHPSQSKALVANYTIPLDSGSTVVLYGVASDSNVETLGSTSVLGRGTTLGVRYVLPLPMASAQSAGYHSLSFGLDYKRLRQTVQQGGIGAVDTPLRYLPFQLAYNGSWSEAGVSNTLSATFSTAMRRLLRRQTDDCPLADGGFGPQDQFACSRRGADGSFASFRLDGRHSEPIAAWEGSSLSLRLAGQWATQPLVSAEQFAAGGAETVRGYLEGAAAGDRALLGSLELRSPNLWTMFAGSPAAAPEGGAAHRAVDLSALAFMDYARVDLIDPLEGEAGSVWLQGLGLGLRLAYGRDLSAALDVARAQKAISRQDRGELRWHARVGLRF